MNILPLKISLFFLMLLPYSIYMVLGITTYENIYSNLAYMLLICSLTSIAYSIYFFKIKIKKPINNFNKYILTYVDVKKETIKPKNFIVINTILLILSNRLKPTKQSIIVIVLLLILVGITHIKNSLYVENSLLELFGLNVYIGTAIFEDNIKRNVTLLYNNNVYKDDNCIYFVSNLENDIYFINQNK